MKKVIEGTNGYVFIHEDSSFRIVNEKSGGISMFYDADSMMECLLPPSSGTFFTQNLEFVMEIVGYLHAMMNVAPSYARIVSASGKIFVERFFIDEAAYSFVLTWLPSRAMIFDTESAAEIAAEKLNNHIGRKGRLWFKKK